MAVSVSTSQAGASACQRRSLLTTVNCHGGSLEIHGRDDENVVDLLAGRSQPKADNRRRLKNASLHASLALAEARSWS
jgi:hypothetical protein